MEEKGMKKLWDILSPFGCILLCMLGATMLGTMGYGVISGVHGLNSELILEMAPWLSLVISLLCSILTLVILRKGYQLDQIRLGVDRKDWNPLQYGAAALGAAAAAHVWSSQIYFSGIQKIFTGYEETASRAFEGQPILLVILATVIGAPIAEELVFRSMIYRRAKSYFGWLPAFVISAFLFGIYHANVVQFIYAVGFSIVLVWIYEKSGNLLAPILCHAGANLWAVVLDAFLPEYSSSPSIPMLLAEILIAVAAGTFLMKKVKKM